MAASRKSGPKLARGEMRKRVGDLHRAGLSGREIATRLGVTKSTVAYHLRNLGSDPDARFSRRYDWPTIQETYDEGLTYRQCAGRFGFNSGT